MSVFSSHSLAAPRLTSWATYIQHWARATSTQPPLLLTSESAELLATASEEVAALTLCAGDASAACTSCQACRWVAHRRHPDLAILAAPKGEGSIAALRAILDALALKPFGKRRLILITGIEAVSRPAATILLKALEEPLATTRWLLTSQFPRRILPTILSRCHRYHLPAMRPPVPAAVGYEPDLLQRLRDTDELSADELQKIAAALSYYLRETGPTPALRRAFFRLRDYYKITALKGNEKLAREVLFASLP